MKIPPIMPSLHVSVAMSITRPIWIMNIMMKTGILMSVQSAFDVIPEEMLNNAEL
jgi:hypothetical protein